MGGFPYCHCSKNVKKDVHYNPYQSPFPNNVNRWLAVAVVGLALVVCTYCEMIDYSYPFWSHNVKQRYLLVNITTFSLTYLIVLTVHITAVEVAFVVLALTSI